MRYCSIGFLFLLIVACQKQNNSSYINETGVYYSFDKLNELEVNDSAKKKFTVEFVENEGTDEIIHFKHANTFHFYQIVADSSQTNSWIIGRIDYEYDIIKTLITRDSLTIKSTYESIYDIRENINGASILLADHAGTIQIYIQAPEHKLNSENGTSSIWVSGHSFLSRNGIQWTITDSKINGKMTDISTGNSLRLKELVGAKNQVIVRYTKEF